MNVTLQQAQAVLQAAYEKAVDLGIGEHIAVVDAGANPVAFLRMDGAWLGSIDVAIKKVKTARLFDMPTTDLGEMAQPGEPLYGIERFNHGLISFGGGLPIKDDAGRSIGAVGASDSTVDVAKAGLKALAK